MRKSLIAACVVATSAFGLGCDSEPDGPGEAIEEAADEMGDAIEDAGDEIKDATDN